MLYLLTQTPKNSKSINNWENLEKMRIYFIYYLWKMDQSNVYDWTKCPNSALTD